MIKKRVLLELILTSVDLVWHDWLFRDTPFVILSNLETNDSPKFTDVQALNNPINIFSLNPNIILYRVFSLNN